MFKEYSKRKSSLLGDEYTRFKSFLNDRKAEDLELFRLGTGLDDEEADKCDHCGIKGHSKKECWKLKRENKDKEY